MPPLIVGMMQNVQGRSQPSEILRYALGAPRFIGSGCGMSKSSSAGPSAEATASHCSAPKVASTEGTASRTRSAAIWVRQPTT